MLTLIAGRDSEKVTVFDHSVHDDRTGDLLFFNSNGAYLFLHYAEGISLVLKGKGLSFHSDSTAFLEDVAADRVVIAEVISSRNTASATVLYKGAIYTLTDSHTRSNTTICRTTEA